ncbi:hypothetical protein Ciccas_006642 [Cichlidogyrus casuarinus]|uniref:Uncharacterized protein n=1 Tax=Cichlidogyrus casuarinus TaxID=1844966 RepID=A0ABD2Q566_9PLAT
MGCELSKVYNIEIHLENESGVFNPKDDVTGHVLIQVDEDTVVHSSPHIKHLTTKYLLSITKPPANLLYLKGTNAKQLPCPFHKT